MAVVTELGLSLDTLFSDSMQPGVDPVIPATQSAKEAGSAARDAKAENVQPRQTLSEGDDQGERPDRPSGLLPIADGASWTKAVIGPWTALGVERAGKRAFLELESGVRWERLTPHSLPGMEFLYVVYEVGASSTAHGKHTRHEGIEFGCVTSGTLHVTVGFDEIVLETGDSIMFDAATPHRLENKGEVPVEAVWFIIGRQSLGARPPQ
jgi:mannose-6-phosphate isomerase-like protein (cupin superfamily)